MQYWRASNQDSLVAAPILRPRSTPEIVDAAFQLARRHFMPLLVVSAIVAIPTLILGAINAWLLPAPNPEEPFGDAWLMTMPLSLLSMCWSFIGYGAVTVAASAAYLGGSADAGQGLRQALRRAVPLVFGNLLGYLIMLLPFLALGVLAPLLVPQLATSPGGGSLLGALLLLVLGVLAVVWMFMNIARVTLVTPVAALERGGPLASWRRASALADGSKKRILGLVLIAAVVILGLVFGGFALLGMVIANENLASALAGVVAIPLWPVLGSLFVVLYYDLRIRKEAFDLEVMTEGLGEVDTAESAGRPMR